MGAGVELTAFRADRSRLIMRVVVFPRSWRSEKDKMRIERQSENGVLEFIENGKVAKLHLGDGIASQAFDDNRLSSSASATSSSSTVRVGIGRHAFQPLPFIYDDLSGLSATVSEDVPVSRWFPRASMRAAPENPVLDRKS